MLSWLGSTSTSSYGHQGKLCLLATSAGVCLCACTGTCVRPGNSCCNKSVAAPSTALGFQLGELTFGEKVLTWEFVEIWIGGEDSGGGLHSNLLINLTHWLCILLYAVVYLTEMWVWKKKKTKREKQDKLSPSYLHIQTFAFQAIAKLSVSRGIRGNMCSSSQSSSSCKVTPG